MLSLKHGERYSSTKISHSLIVSVTIVFRLAYADYLLSAMIDQNLLPSTVNVLYDIGCKLMAHWKVYS